MAVARKWRQNIWENFENLQSLDCLKWHFRSFLYLFSQGPTHKRQNKSLVHQKYADLVGFSWKCADRNSAKIFARGTRSPRRPNFTVWSVGNDDNKKAADWENNCFIIYTRSEFTDFAFRIFSIFFYFVYVFIFALSADYFFKNIYF
jgi:hypothetical protein